MIGRRIEIVGRFVDGICWGWKGSPASFQERKPVQSVPKFPSPYNRNGTAEIA